jgi:hypothetical protein
MSEPKLTFSFVGQFFKATEVDRNLITDVRATAPANKDFVFEARLAANTTATVSFQAVTVAEFLFIRAFGGDCQVTLTPEDASQTTLEVDDILILTGTRVTALSVSSLAGCRVTVYGGSN